MELLIAFLVVMVFIFIGEWGSNFSKAYIPSVFITAALFTIGFWTFLPKDIVNQASFGKEFVAIAVPLLLVHLGTMMDLKQLAAQWRAVVVALAGVVGTMVLTLTIGTLLFDWHTVVAAVPPLTGGVISVALMSDGLKAEGLTTLVAIPVAMYITHSIIGYPLTSVVLKREGKRLLKQYDNQKLDFKNAELSQEADETLTKKPTFLKSEKFQTPAFLLAKVALVAVLAVLLEKATNKAINGNVIALVLGVIFHQIGFLEKQILNKAKVFNWLMYGLLAFVFSQLSMTTPKVLSGIMILILVLIALGILGMYLASSLLSKPLKMSKDMAFATALTALFGFPADYILTNEVVNNLTKDEKARNVLIDYMMPKMLVGGFATVSVASIIIASLFLKLL
ncbi:MULTISPECIES: hypothetical protein [Staphylococcus]|uniref:hypothetical protein n=1 Tax=Staphylococcus TaxID=1279 RepID=UPI0008A91246|nr:MULTISPECIES: hypothetical protein [Staphylococcus]OHR58189.1 hypothetical protein HMPREF2937_01705 [Staphylococcus sp. HMSC061G12]UXR48253.1 hypothetical protein MUA57_03540 [Staphylococcus simulans]